MRAKVAGAHRRQRPSPRSGRGAVWIGLFLLLAVVALAVSQDLWSEVARGLLSTERRPVPQGTVLWQAPCPVDALVSVNSWGVLLLAYREEGATHHSSRVTLRQVTARDETVLAVDIERPLALAFRNREAASPDEAPLDGAEDWRAIVIRPLVLSGGDASRGFSGPAEQLISLGPDSDQTEAYISQGAVATAAYLWADGFRAVLGLYQPDLGSGSRSIVVAVDDSGREQWSRLIDRLPLHRVVSRPGSGFIAAASPEVFALLDVRGNLLWTKNMRSKVVDLALQSHGGPAVISGRRLLVYDRRGNLLWKKDADELLTAVACAGQRIAVAHGATVAVYDEEGLLRWSLTFSSKVVNLELDAEASLAAVLLDTGNVVVTRAPGGAP